MSVNCCRGMSSQLSTKSAGRIVLQRANFFWKSTFQRLYFFTVTWVKKPNQCFSIFLTQASLFLFKSQMCTFCHLSCISFHRGCMVQLKYLHDNKVDSKHGARRYWESTLWICSFLFSVNNFDFSLTQSINQGFRKERTLKGEVKSTIRLFSTANKQNGNVAHSHMTDIPTCVISDVIFFFSLIIQTILSRLCRLLAPLCMIVCCYAQLSASELCRYGQSLTAFGRSEGNQLWQSCKLFLWRAKGAWTHTRFRSLYLYQSSVGSYGLLIRQGWKAPAKQYQWHGPQKEV